MQEFKNLTIDNKALDPLFIKNNEYKSVVLPEFPSLEELEKISNILKENRFVVYLYEYGGEPDKIDVSSIVKVNDYIKDYTYKNIIIKFVNSDAYVYSPESHEYFVLFGKESAVTAIKNSSVFDYGFEEYLTSDHMSENSKVNLQQIFNTYSV